MDAVKTLYVCCPANAVQGPAERKKYQDRAECLAGCLEAELTVSPLLDRFMGPASRLSVEERIEDLKTALSYDAVMACRGGFGSIQLLEDLADAPAKLSPLLFGFSDITALHALWRTRGWTHTYYGAPPTSLEHCRAGESLKAFCRNKPLTVDHRREAMVRVLRPGEAEGETFAACLAVLSSLCGTPYMPDLSGTMLFLEDINENPWQWDTGLTQLYLSGVFEGVRALACGSFCHSVDNDYGGPTVDEVLSRWADKLGIPVISRLPYGHMDDPMGIPNGRQCRLAATPEAWSLAW